MPLRITIAPSATFVASDHPRDAYVPHYVTLRQRHLRQQRRADAIRAIVHQSAIFPVALLAVAGFIAALAIALYAPA